MSKGFFKWQRNPFKIWQSYVGLILAGFMPIPLGYFGFVPAGILMLSIFKGSFGIPLFLMFFSILVSGFFVGASIKRGRDNFIQYAVFFLILSVIFYWLTFFTSAFGSLQ